MEREFNISAFIRNKRAELQMTVRELAAKVGVAPTTISKWENGRISHLKEDKIRPLADALRVHPLTLFGYSNQAQMREYNETPIKRIPIYSKKNVDFFADQNVLKFISTDIDADYAVIATRSHEDVIKPHDTLLMSRSFSDLHNKYVLLIDDNPNTPPYIDKLVIIHNKMFLFNEGTYEILPDNVKVIGVLVQIRRLP